MSHFAEIDKDGIVLRTIVAEQDFINTGAVGDSFNWIQTSYSGGFRKQFAGVGFTWDKTNDVFIAPQPYPSWTLDAVFDWQPPTAYPDDNIAADNSGHPHSDTRIYDWNEATLTWDDVGQWLDEESPTPGTNEVPHSLDPATKAGARREE